MTKPVDEWRKSLAYLPAPMRDFHDQKDLFKAIHDTIDVEGHSTYVEDISWIDGQVYTVDIFLWYMAKHGYTLQKSRADVDFVDLEMAVAAKKAQADEHAMNALKAMFDKKDAE